MPERPEGCFAQRCLTPFLDTLSAHTEVGRMSWKSSRVGCAAAVFWLLALAGCDRGAPPLTAVRGQVFYQGRPLSQGLVVFTPDADRGAIGPSAKGDI